MSFAVLRVPQLSYASASASGGAAAALRAALAQDASGFCSGAASVRLQFVRDASAVVGGGVAAVDLALYFVEATPAASAACAAAVRAAVVASGLALPSTASWGALPGLRATADVTAQYAVPGSGTDPAWGVPAPLTLVDAAPSQTTPTAPLYAAWRTTDASGAYGLSLHSATTGEEVAQRVLRAGAATAAFAAPAKGGWPAGTYLLRVHRLGGGAWVTTALQVRATAVAGLLQVRDNTVKTVDKPFGADVGPQLLFDPSAGCVAFTASGVASAGQAVGLRLDTTGQALRLRRPGDAEAKPIFGWNPATNSVEMSNVDSGTFEALVVGAGGSRAFSDARLKTDVQALPDCLASILALRPVSFRWIGGTAASSGSTEDLGLIAQEVEAVLPLLVKATRTPEAFKAVAYSKLTAVLAGALQEQHAEVEALRAEVAALRGACCPPTPPCGSAHSSATRAPAQ